MTKFHYDFWRKLFLAENSEIQIFAISSVFEGKNVQEKKACIGRGVTYIKMAY